MAQSTLTKTKGLYTHPNNLELPEGALIDTNNVVCDRENIIESRRGFKIYGDDMGTSETTDTAHQLMVYKDRIIRHFGAGTGTTLDFDTDGAGTFVSFTGTYAEPSEAGGEGAITGSRIKGIEANGNFYFTTSDGIKKISATEASDITASSITNAGGIKALDGEAFLNYSTGWFTQDSVVAYRIVWGYVDLNNNTILGSPSERIIVSNSLTNLLLRDFNLLLSTIDGVSGAVIADANYVTSLKVSANSSAFTLQSAIVGLTQKLDEDTVISSTVAVSGGSHSGYDNTVEFASSIVNYLKVGDVIEVAGSGNSYANGLFEITSLPSTSSVKYRTNYSMSPANTSPASTVRRLSYQILDMGTRLKSYAPSSIEVASSVCTIKISSGDFTDEFSPGDIIKLSGFSGNALPINGVFTLSTVTGTALTFTIQASNIAVDSTESDMGQIELLTYRPPELSTNPTNAELTLLQEFYDTIVSKLQLELSGIAGSTAATTFASNGSTQSATVDLRFTVPANLTSEYFYQIYRTQIFTASGITALSDLDPGDEQALIIQDNPSSTTSGTVIEVSDIVPDSFRGANLYTNPQTGDGRGILDANEVPPLAQDITTFRNSTFYANTQTKQRLTINLLSVLDFQSNTSSITIAADGGISNTYTFVSGTQQVTTLTCIAATSSMSSRYFYIYSARDLTEYYVWYKVDAVGTDPAPTGKTGILVSVVTGDTNAQVAEKTRKAINVYNDFTATDSSNTVTITNVDNGTATSATLDATLTSLGFTISTSSGVGESAANKKVVYTPEPAEQFVKTITDTTPSSSSRTQITIASHGYSNGDTIYISGTNSTPEIEGYFLISDVATNTFTIPFDTTATGNTGSALKIVKQITPSQQVDECARSLVRVINQQASENCYAYYLSGVNDIPGQILLEARALGQDPFYISANSTDTSGAFNPDLKTITAISGTSVANPTVITTSSNHGLATGDEIIISGSSSTPTIDGIHTVTVTGATTFTIPVNVTVTSSTGKFGGLQKISEANVSSNEVFPNRLYYSKFSQPEAVPIVNYFDVGKKDKKILRIVALRDSLFIFKEDGVYRLSGQSISNFVVFLFDGGTNCNAVDSVVALNNLIYLSSDGGIVSVSDTGVSVISRPIEKELIKLYQYTNFASASFGVGYETDRAYYFFTLEKSSDTYAQRCFRFNIFTTTWTVLDMSKRCGVVNEGTDKLYLGATDTNYIEIERKTFDRTDYADRQYAISIGGSDITANVITVGNTSDYNVGDVIVQTQYLTTDMFNDTLKTLDDDLGVTLTTYEQNLTASAGSDLRALLNSLANQLDSDTLTILDRSVTGATQANPCVVTVSTAHYFTAGMTVTFSGVGGMTQLNGNTYTIANPTATTFELSGTNSTGYGAYTSGGTASSTFASAISSYTSSFSDTQSAFNVVTGLLNNDTNTQSNYDTSEDTTDYEVEITEVDSTSITTATTYPFIVGPATIYNRISSSFIWAPDFAGDASILKHTREGTVLFENNNITTATISYATDLSAGFESQTYTGQGTGSYGNSSYGEINFGGTGQAAPFRGLIPKEKQRNRYIKCKYEHSIARQKYSVYGRSYTFEPTSSRAYR